MQKEIRKLVHVPSRTGRELQRFHLGRRQVVGCIPYRHVNTFSSSVQGVVGVLMVSSQKGETMLFPKGGWEKDESKQEAALRESLEEAGVIGCIQPELGHWIYKSKSQDVLHDGYIFPLLVEEQLDFWPEKDIRQRKWVTVAEAKELCPHSWMTEALDLLIQRLTIEELHPTPKINLVEGVIDYFSNSSKSQQQLETESESEVSGFRILSLHANVSPHNSMEHERVSNGQQNVIEKKSSTGSFHLSIDSVFRCSVSCSDVHRLNNGSSTLLRSAV